MERARSANQAIPVPPGVRSTWFELMYDNLLGRSRERIPKSPSVVGVGAMSLPRATAPREMNSLSGRIRAGLDGIPGSAPAIERYPSGGLMRNFQPIPGGIGYIEPVAEWRLSPTDVLTIAGKDGHASLTYAPHIAT